MNGIQQGNDSSMIQNQSALYTSSIMGKRVTGNCESLKLWSTRKFMLQAMREKMNSQNTDALVFSLILVLFILISEQSSCNIN
jgi:hypothetical protein